MQKPICLITGATEGIGRATAIELASRGFSVVIAARDAARAEAAKNEIAAETDNPDIDTIVADLRSFAQVRQLCETFHRRYPRLDVLVNNAGILASENDLTEDGFEATLLVNYLSAFYLTQLMLDALKRAGQGRIINLSSSVHAIGKFDSEHLQRGRRFPAFSAYANSKLLMLLFSIELAERLKNTPVTANAVHPGIVKTPMMLNARGFFRAVAWLALPFAISPQQGAATSVYLATSPEVAEVSGKYFTRSRETKFKTAFNTTESREHLWNLSMQSVGLAGTK
ncbi:SDR family oxidoreductase [Bradyrhizobium erythrophlei]|jgi:NAD(P)-dependent dehydrogenase (short-subunit alcohol dehydrogenase family)|uniref:NAD(P)-dependent dehydrogenase, short-chain alcohol dehydrogenase family n=1 Tax=Bradyrhizobium erythrophlei TaxID=1437360 RepID=A0A1M7UF34_9BRAD|nr:SDR family oxidoreductase [Bradyrhizobium erythrophlei]SHN81515.1 NAD(P)-dependent dehydrogenase, short-chain alcohol dehydrogenase family [Bradyrhizobium erythrophlei]